MLYGYNNIVINKRYIDLKNQHHLLTFYSTVGKFDSTNVYTIIKFTMIMVVANDNTPFYNHDKNSQ